MTETLLALRQSTRCAPSGMTGACDPGGQGRRQHAANATREDALTLKKIRLELGRTKEFPEGNPNHGYEFVAPLTAGGQIDSAAWKAERENCSVLRFAGVAEFERGELIHPSRGRWAFSYAPGEEDDEAIYRLVDHVFKEGEYVSITEHDGVTRPFRVARISDWRPEG